MYQRAIFFQIHVIMGILPIHASLVNILIFSLILLFFLTILLYSLLLHFLEYKYMFSKDDCIGESKTFSRCLLLIISHW